MTARKIRMLNIIDEFTHECLAIRVPASSRPSTSSTCCRTCSSCAAFRGTSDPTTAPSSSPKAVQDWIAAVGASTAYIARGSPWENGFIESFNARLRDELLDGEIFYTLREAQIVIESWRRHYNAVRPHASIGYQAPAPEVFVPALAAWPAAQPRLWRALTAFQSSSLTMRRSGTSSTIRRSGVPAGPAPAGRRVLHELLPVPDQAADVQLVVEDAGAPGDVAADRGGRHGPPRGPGTCSLLSWVAIAWGLRPAAYSSKIRTTTAASAWLIFLAPVWPGTRS